MEKKSLQMKEYGGGGECKQVIKKVKLNRIQF